MNEDKTTVIVSEDYTRAVTLTRNIIANAQAAQQSLYEVCKGLKEMRDGKLYKELGYSSFDNYCENEIGIGRFQAYKYAAIADMENVDSSQHFDKIGVTKLFLLAKLDEPTREAVTETIDVESVTVKELKAQITALTAERDEAKATIETKDKQFKAAMESKDAQLKAAQDTKESAMSECNHLNSIIREKESRIKELEEQPIQHDITDVDSAAEIERLKKELEDEQLRVMMVEKSAESKARLAAESVREEYERKLAEQDTAADTKDVFKAYLANAADALTRLLTYLESIRDDKNLPLYVSKVDGIVEMTQTRRNAL
jgi:DNA repair exonuclease SbcCD ATPase subunit